MRKLYFIFQLLILILIESNQLYSQLDSFKLSDYKLPDLKRKGIDIQNNIFGQVYNFDYKDGYLSNEKTFQNNLNVSYFLYKNSKKYQGDFRCNFLSKFSSVNDEGDYSKSFSKSFQNQLSFSSSNRFYGKNKVFINLTANGSVEREAIDYWRSYDTVQNPGQINIDARILQNRINLNTYLGFGKGRIENVEDARHALYILEELNSQNRLKHMPSQEEILQFSERISAIKNERVLDSRLKKIYELNQLDSVLHELDLVDPWDMVYFSVLNDMWDYGGNIQRNYGLRFEIRYNPYFSFSQDVNQDNFTNSESSFFKNEFRNEFEVLVVWAKPIKQKFQSNLNSSVFYFFTDSYNEYRFDPYQNQLKKGYGGNFMYDFAYYPNTRISINVGLIILGEKYKVKYDEMPENETEEYFRYEYRPYLTANYYFSPKLSIILNYYYEFLKSSDTNWLSFNRHYFSTTIKYSIF